MFHCRFIFVAMNRKCWHQDSSIWFKNQEDFKMVIEDKLKLIRPFNYLQIDYCRSVCRQNLQIDNSHYLYFLNRARLPLRSSRLQQLLWSISQTKLGIKFHTSIGIELTSFWLEGEQHDHHTTFSLGRYFWK